MGELIGIYKVPVFKLHSRDEADHRSFERHFFRKGQGDEYVVNVIQICRDLLKPQKSGLQQGGYPPDPNFG